MRCGFKAKDIDKIMSGYASDESLFVFDVIPPRQYVGAAAYRKDWQELFAAFPGPVEAAISDLSVTADRTLGCAGLIAHSVLTDKTARKSSPITGPPLSSKFQKTGGKWLIVHEHNSVPVDFSTGKADMLSKPEAG